MIRELAEGIDDSGVRAGNIGEIGLSGMPQDPFQPQEEVVLRAAARAQAATGASLTIHPNAHLLIYGEKPVDHFDLYLDILEEEGCDLGKVYVSHLGLFPDVAVPLRLLSRGVGFVSYDHFGHEEYAEGIGPGRGFTPDREEVGLVMQLLDGRPRRPHPALRRDRLEDLLQGLRRLGLLARLREHPALAEGGGGQRDADPHHDGGQPATPSRHRLTFVAGIDLAWGERMPDGVCFARLARGRARILGYAYPRGDAALLDALAERIPRSAPALLTIDAPIVCPNRTGTRPVDRLTHRLFHREHAGCHPANLGQVSAAGPRAARAAEPGLRGGLGARGGRAPRGGGVSASGDGAAAPAAADREVQARPGGRASPRVRPAAAPAAAAARHRARVRGDRRETAALLRAEWSKPVEDRVDAFFCALLALWHLRHRGRRSQTIGDLATGFILLPEDLRGRPARLRAAG